MANKVREDAIHLDGSLGFVRACHTFSGDVGALVVLQSFALALSAECEKYLDDFRGVLCGLRTIRRCLGGH